MKMYFKVKINIKNTATKKTVSKIEEVFEDFFEAVIFLNQIIKSLKQEKFLLNRILYYELIRTEEREGRELKTAQFSGSAKDGKNRTKPTLKIYSTKNIDYFMNNLRLFASSFIPSSPWSAIYNEQSDFIASLDPELVVLEYPRKDKISNAIDIYANCPNFPEWVCCKAKDKEFISSGFNPNNLNKNNFYLLFAMLIPSAADSLTLIFRNSKTSFDSVQGNKIVLSDYTGVFASSDITEYSKQYKKACIQILEQFEKGVLKTYDAQILNWIHQTQILLKTEHNS